MAFFPNSKYITLTSEELVDDLLENDKSDVKFSTHWIYEII
jgi:hypothetical protein